MTSDLAKMHLMQAIRSRGLRMNADQAITSSAAPPAPMSVSPNNGQDAGGMLVTVTGTGFQTTGTTLVKFGSAAAVIATVSSSTTLTCTTPASNDGDNAVNVTVTGPDSQGGTLVNGYTYIKYYLLDSFTDSFTPVTYLQDNFMGTSGTILPSHTMDVGGGWTSQSNNFMLNGAGAAGPINGSDCYNTADSGHNDMEITGNVWMDSSGDNVGVAGWYVSSVFNYWLVLDRYTSLFPGRFGLQLGNSGWVDYVAFSITTNQHYALKLRLIGHTIIGYLNGVPLVGCFDETSNQNTLAGIRTAVDSHTLVSNFLVVKPCSSTLLTAHTMDVGSGWAADQNNFIMDGLGNALPTSGASAAVVVGDAGHADATASLDVTPISQTISCVAGVVARYVDHNNHWVYRINQTTGKVELIKIFGGTPTTVANPSETFAQGTKYTLKLITSGNNFTGYLNGVQVLTATDSFEAAATKWGIRNDGGLNQYGNFSVRAA